MDHSKVKLIEKTKDEKESNQCTIAFMERLKDKIKKFPNHSINDYNKDCQQNCLNKLINILDKDIRKLKIKQENLELYRLCLISGIDVSGVECFLKGGCQ